MLLTDRNALEEGRPNAESQAGIDDLNGGIDLGAMPHPSRPIGTLQNISPVGRPMIDSVTDSMIEKRGHSRCNHLSKLGLIWLKIQPRNRVLGCGPVGRRGGESQKIADQARVFAAHVHRSGGR